MGLEASEQLAQELRTTWGEIWLSTGSDKDLSMKVSMARQSDDVLRGRT
jgi:hypothetical protein